MTRCHLATCMLFTPGHAMHVDHAKQLTEAPHEWCSAVVTDLRDGVVTAALVERPMVVQVWHHRDLSREIAVGDPVRVHRRLHALGWPYGWVNAELIAISSLAEAEDLDSLPLTS